jgi:diguanylate cyclase (GGDEF)-like protein
VFVVMFLGLHWFVVRQPFRAWWWSIPIAGAMALYAVVFVAKLHLWSFAVFSLPVLGISAATVWMLLRQKSERFRIASRLTAGLLTAHICLLTYRVALSLRGYSAANRALPWLDARWMYSMVGIMFVSFCILLMYVLFTVIEMHSHVERAADVDALTGALNRRALSKHAARELAESERLGTALALVEIDLDHFKRINDTYGHGGGDATLCAFVDLAKECLRSSDVVARMGGEEFVLLLPSMNTEEAAHMAEGLRHSLEQMRVHHEGKMIVVTASAGVTERQPGDSLETMLKRSDALLYRAKEEGRNRVVVDDTALAKGPVLVEKAEQRRGEKSA